VRPSTAWKEPIQRGAVKFAQGGQVPRGERRRDRPPTWVGVGRVVALAPKVHGKGAELSWPVTAHAETREEGVVGRPLAKAKVTLRVYRCTRPARPG